MSLSSSSLSSLLLLPLLLLSYLLPTLAQSGSSGGSSGGSSAAAAGGGGDMDGGDDTSATKIHYEWAHGALMSIAIGFFFPVGIAMARFFRSPQLSPAWLRLHQFFVTMGIILLIAGFAIAVNKFDNDDYSKRVNHYHRVAGFVVFALFMFQWVLGWIRPHAPPIGSGEKLTNQRRGWNLVHHWNGRIAYIFSLAQIYTGISMLDGGSMTLWRALFSGIWGGLFVLLILLQIIVCAKNSAFGDDGTATKVTWFGSTVDRADNSAAGNTSAAVRKGNDAPTQQQPQYRTAEMTQTSASTMQPSSVQVQEPSTMV